MKNFKITKGNEIFFIKAKDEEAVIKLITNSFKDMSAKDSPAGFVSNLNLNAFEKNILNMKNGSSSLQAFNSNLNAILADISDWKRYATQQTTFDDLPGVREDCRQRCETYLKLLTNISKDSRIIFNLDSTGKALITKCINNLNAAKSSYFSNYRKRINK